jgi:anti-anti-sigma factor
MSAPPVFPCPPEITADQVPALESGVDRLLGEQGTRVVLDLDQTTFVGSAGLGLLVKLGKRLHDRGGGLALARPRPPVQRLLRVVGLGEVLPYFTGLDEAAEHLRRTARV